MKLGISSIAALALVLGFAAADDGYAQEYPAKPIRLIISSSPGSGVDTIARAVAQRMSEALGVQVIPDNRAGGGGTIGVQAVAKAPGDGYTLLMGAPSFTVNATLVKPPPYEFPRDFAAIGQATTAPYIVVVHPSLPVKSVKELIALAKARPGQLNFGSGGTGNSTHLTGEYFKHLTQTNIVHVPYKGSGPAVVDLLGGHIQLMFANLVAVPNVVRGLRERDDRCGAAASAAEADRGRSRVPRRHDLVVRPPCAARDASGSDPKLNGAREGDAERHGRKIWRRPRPTAPTIARLIAARVGGKSSGSPT
jgi:tripartite-type tricarboxylate transporter receptor subunit TctC